MTADLKPGVRVQIWDRGKAVREATIVRVELPFLVWLDDGFPGAVHPCRLKVIEEVQKP